MSNFTEHRNDTTHSNCSKKELCAHCVTIGKWDAKIAETQTLLDNMKQCRNYVRTEANRNHDPLIQRTPPEISSYIFTLDVNDDSYDRFLGLPRALILASVCRKWREIALATPQLWSYIDIHQHNKWNFPVTLAETFLARSGQLPLTISLSWYNVPETDGSEIEELAGLICAHMNRWKFLTVKLPAVAFRFFRSDIPIQLNIDKLHLASFPTRPSPPGPFRPINITLQPKTLTLDYILPSLVTVDWQNITCLNIIPITIPEALNVIPKCHRIELLELWFQSHLESDDLGTATQFTLRYLKDLRCCVYIREIEKFFDAITTPTLSCLQYSQLDKRGNLAPLKFMLQRSACSLTKLRLDCLSRKGLNEDNVIDFIYTFPSLTTIHLNFKEPVLSSDCSLFQRVLMGLTGPLKIGAIKNTLQSHLSRLQSLRYDGERCFSWNTIAKIYQICSESETINIAEQSKDWPPLYSLNSLTVLTPDPKNSADFIEQENLLIFLKQPKNGFELTLNPELVKASIEKHSLNIDNDVSFYLRKPMHSKWN